MKISSGARWIVLWPANKPGSFFYLVADTTYLMEPKLRFIAFDESLIAPGLTLE